jgi:predicted alpha-1,2-mannosidase
MTNFMKNMIHRIQFGLLICASLLVAGNLMADDATDPARCVNPFIGTADGGNTTPSAQAPFGMISPGPVSAFQKYGGVESRSTYDAQSKEAIAFSLTHISGVGCHAGGDLPFMPTVGPMERSPVAGKLPGEVTTSATDKDAYQSRISNQVAEPGWYQARLDDADTTVSIAAATRSALVRFDYPKTNQAGIIFCPANDIKGITDSSVTIDRDARVISGWVSTGGFGDAPFKPDTFTYRVYFSAQFDRPFASFGVWDGERRTPNGREVHSASAAAYLGFDTTRKQAVEMRIAISYVDQAGAEENLQAEQNNLDLDGLRQRTHAAWNEVLRKLTMTGGTESDSKVWATALYHNLLHPNIFDDADGRYIGFDDKIHHVDPGHHFYANYSIWDTYRTTGPLQTLLLPRVAGDMAETMLLAATQGGGGLPSWSLNNNDTRCMGSYPGPILLANFVAFGAQGVNLQAAKDRMVESAKHSLPCKQASGWGDLDQYLALGWKPDSASETLEFAISDFAIAEFCQRLGDETNARRFLKRAGSWRNLVNPQLHGIWPRRADGSWVGPLTPESQNGFTEGCSEQYTWCVPQDTAGLISLLGTPAEVRDRLEKFFDPFLVGGWHPGQPKYWCGNEPTLGCPYVFLYLGSPWLAQELVSRVAGTFKDTSAGLPGNDDLGATSASYLFSAIGLYPYIPGVGGFVITGPRFPQIEMTLGDGKKLTIHATNAGPQNSYIQSMKVNGRPWSRTWISLADLKTGSGATLEFVMGPKPNQAWGSRPEDAPPSPASAERPVSQR